MKVLKKGRNQKAWAKEFECTGNGNKGGGCGALLLVEITDIYLTFSSHYDGSNETYRTFSCPICKVETDIASSTSLPTFEFPNKTKFKLNAQESL